MSRKKILNSFFCFLIFNLLVSINQFVFASESVTVTASIPDEIPPSNPILVAPDNGSIIAENKPTFVFKKSYDAQSPVRHYVMYLNDTLFIPEIPSSQTPVETSQFYCIITNDSISVSLKDSLDDGVYTWKIRAYDMYGNWSDSATWTFTIDTTPPFIIITTIGENMDLNLSSENLQAFSPKPTVQTKLTQPIISGRSEPGVKIQINLNLITGNQQLYLTLSGIADENGKFSFTPKKKLFPGIYNVTAIAIDVALNTTVLPEFFLEVFLKEVKITPSPKPFLPIIPSIPPKIIEKPKAILQLPQATPYVPLYYQVIPYLTLLLLLLWLVTSKYGYGFAWRLAGKYLFSFLVPPFFKRKKISLTFNFSNKNLLAFVTIIIFEIKENNTKELKKFLTDHKARFNLKLELGNYKLNAIQSGFKQTWENITNPFSCNLGLCTPLFPDPERYRKYVLLRNLAKLFLCLAFISSIFFLLFWPNLLTLLIFIICLDFIICFLL